MGWYTVLILCAIECLHDVPFHGEQQATPYHVCQDGLEQVKYRCDASVDQDHCKMPHVHLTFDVVSRSTFSRETALHLKGEIIIEVA